MAVAFVGVAGNKATATSVTTTYSSSGGQLLCSLRGAGYNTINISDTAGNLWRIVANLLAPQALTVFATVSTTPAAVTSVTATVASSLNIELIVAEYSGVGEVRQLPFNKNTAATSTTASISSTLLQANDFLLAFGVKTGAGAFTANTGNFRISQISNNGIQSCLVDNTAGTATSVTCAATTASVPWGMCAVELCVSPMSLNVKNLVNNGSTVASASFTTASITPVSGTLLLITVMHGDVTLKYDVPQISGCNIVWKEIYSSNIATTRHATFFYGTADGASTTGALTFGFTASQARCSWLIEQVHGQDTTTPISWCVQAATSPNNTANVNQTVTLSTLQDANSLCYVSGYTATAAAGTITPNAGFSFSGWVLQRGGIGVLSVFSLNGTNTGGQSSISVIYTLLALEITSSNSGLRNNPLQQRLLGSSGGGT